MNGAEAGFNPAAARRGWGNARGLLIVFLVIAAIVGWNRDFGVFIFELLALPVIVIAGLILSLIVLPRRPFLRAAVAEIGAVAAIVVVAVIVNAVHDRVVGSLWAIAHPVAVYRAMTGDRIVTHLEAWGAAFTVDNDSYLVVDTRDGLTSPAGAEAWRRRMATPCAVVYAERIWPKLFVAITADCNFGVTTDVEAS